MSHRADIAKLAFWLAFIIGAIWYAVAQYRVCRELGLSVFYCIRHAGIV
jgi:hypothetical protein